MLYFDAFLQVELLASNSSTASAQLQHQMLQQQLLVLKEDAKLSAAAASSAAAALSASEVRTEELWRSIEEQRAAHLNELRQVHDEKYENAVRQQLFSLVPHLMHVLIGLHCKKPPLRWRAGTVSCSPNVQPKYPLLRRTDCTLQKWCLESTS
jgi:hypothetical protein